jgi:hypothetical protein
MHGVFSLELGFLMTEIHTAGQEVSIQHLLIEAGYHGLAFSACMYCSI